MQDAMQLADCYDVATDNEFSDSVKKINNLSECSLCSDNSNTSLNDNDNTIVDKSNNDLCKSCNANVKLKSSLQDSKNNAMVLFNNKESGDSGNKMVEVNNINQKKSTRRDVRRRTTVSRRRKNNQNSDLKALEEPGNCHSLVGLDWLFERNDETPQTGRFSIYFYLHLLIHIIVLL